MGLNYYVKANLCSHCGQYRYLHLGKSSAGWKFLFRMHVPEGDPKTADDWRALTEKFPIFTEYDTPVSYDEFWGMVECKQTMKLGEVDESGYRRTYTEFS